MCPVSPPTPAISLSVSWPIYSAEKVRVTTVTSGLYVVACPAIQCVVAGIADKCVVGCVADDVVIKGITGAIDALIFRLRSGFPRYYLVCK